MMTHTSNDSESITPFLYRKQIHAECVGFDIEKGCKIFQMKSTRDER